MLDNNNKVKRGDDYSIWEAIMLIITVLAAILILYHIYRIHKRGAAGSSLSSVVDYATEKSAFSPTVFQIYDKSTEKVCDRLVLVRPFDWYIWACRGELYVLNPESGLYCGAGKTPAIRVYVDQFVETCLKLNYDTILSSYRKLPVKHVPYTIEEDSTTFTILSALNLLVRDEWITFDTETIKTVDTFIHPGSKTSSSTMTTTTTTTRKRRETLKKNERNELSQEGRSLTYHQLLKLTSSSSSNDGGGSGNNIDDNNSRRRRRLRRHIIANNDQDDQEKEEEGKDYEDEDEDDDYYYYYYDEATDEKRNFSNNVVVADSSEKNSHALRVQRRNVRHSKSELRIMLSHHKPHVARESDLKRIAERPKLDRRNPSHSLTSPAILLASWQ